MELKEIKENNGEPEIRRRRVPSINFQYEDRRMIMEKEGKFCSFQ